MPETRLRRLAADEPANWPTSLTYPATFTVLDAWSELVKRTYKYPVYRMETEAESGVNGILALTHVRHPLLGNYLTTSPFGSYGGFAYSSLEARDMLLAEARRLADETGVEYVNIRFDSSTLDVGLLTNIQPTLDTGLLTSVPVGWIQNPIYSTFLMDLDSDSEKLLSGFSSDHRNHIRKSLKKGFTVKFGRLDLLNDAYDGLSLSMHELGSPYHSKTYLRTMAENLGDALEFAILYTSNGKIAGAGVFISHGRVVTNLHANILRRYRSDYAGEFLYWKVIERYCQKGFQVFDIGRSLNGSGNETFKMKWKPRKQSLEYWYALCNGAELPHMNQKSPRFQFAIWVWKRLPAFIVRLFGPFLIRGLA